MKSYIVGKNKQKEGEVPAIALVNPKYPANVGKAIRTASCFGIKQVWFTGNRVSLVADKKYRLPREERMKGYKEVELRQHDYFFNEYDRGKVTPVAVEVRNNSELLPDFIHPENALYVFGPEDGSLTSVHLQHCHRFLVIPSKHCLNLAMAVSIVLYDRMAKSGNFFELNEHRGFIEDDEEEALLS